jgi:hypothetical protein
MNTSKIENKNEAQRMIQTLLKSTVGMVFALINNPKDLSLSLILLRFSLFICVVTYSQKKKLLLVTV